MRPASDRARIGVIGTGWWATYAHLPSLTSYERAEVVAIADPSPERLAAAGEHFGIAAQYADYRAMLDRGDLDGVIVATPHSTHHAVAREVLTRGIPLMLEKPMVLRARDARELIDLADRHGVPLVIGYPCTHVVPLSGGSIVDPRSRRGAHQRWGVRRQHRVASSSNKSTRT